MQKTLIFLFVALLFSCKADSDLFLSPATYAHTEEADGLKVDIEIPMAAGEQKMGKAINRGLTEEIIYLLAFNDEMEATSVEEAIASFAAGFKELKTQFPDETPNWEARVKGKTVYEGEKILTIRLDTYLFTGGAHGYNEVIFLNFDKKRAEELAPEELFRNPKRFAEYAEQRFRAKHKIPENTSINSTGFMFEGDTFYLPENIGFNRKGLTLIYNPYEVASYADGPILLELSMDEIQPYLARKFRS